MDPVSVGLLAALAGGAGGELGRQAWAGLSDLVRRPLRRGQNTAQDPVANSAEAELAALGQGPTDPVRAQALSTALAVRAALDTDFRAGLQLWHEQAKLVHAGDAEVHNTISGGTQSGPVFQGRDYSGISFAIPPTSQSVPGDDAPAGQG
ncbi:hypothetical protein [Streptomyces europaeiscabiei]|uniref:hypothetical protein n=1 Tax=Streptomyces europaeiscabiei TaxID=146819 RepID=UPI000E680AE6|nr:hypothetical protein [Streptomyces europaeiscabiei]